MLRPVELLRGGMKFGDAKFSYVIAGDGGCGCGLGLATEELSHAQTKARNRLLAELEACESIATLSKSPFDALSSSLAATAFQVAVHLL